MSNKDNEKKQAALEKKMRLREKQRLQLKASNEMLEEAKQKVIDFYGEGTESADNYIDAICIAQDQNLERAEEYLNVSRAEFGTGEYNEVNPKEAEAYYRRLKKLGKSDELLHMKDASGQLQMYEDNKIRTQAMPTTKKSKSKIQELTDKLRQLNGESEINQTFTEPIADNTKEEKQENIDIIRMAQEFKNVEQNTNKAESAVESVVVYEPPVSKAEINGTSDTFDPRDIPSYVQYDMLPLPSKGECYPHKKASIPVAYLTASDENLITSRNLYNSGSMIDIILERKILDKSIRVKDLCKGDRDAIAIWLRATAYGPEYPIIVPYNGEEIDSVIDLSNIDYLDFDIKGDENGWFEYITGNGDVLKYRILTSGDDEKLFKRNETAADIVSRNSIVGNMDKTLDLLKSVEASDKNDILEAVNLVKGWALNVKGDYSDVLEKTFMTVITDVMCLQTMSVNGNTDRAIIKNYIENMRAKEAYDYRQYIASHTPGVNLEITVPVPESMGGGSYETFLSIGETIFINV